MKQRLSIYMLILAIVTCCLYAEVPKSKSSNVPGKASRIQTTKVFIPNNIEADLQNNGFIFSNFNNQTIRGAIFGSTDNGLTWVELDAGLTKRSINSLISFSGSSGTSLFAGTDSGIYRSGNNGTSWTPVNNGLTTMRLQCLGVNGSAIFAATMLTYGISGGVFRSTDEGQNWTPADSGLTTNAIRCFASMSSVTVAGTFGAGVFRSTDNGQHWALANSGLNSTGTVNSLIASATSLFVAIDGAICRSTDLGITWTPSNTGVANYGVVTLAVAGSNLYAGTVGGGVFISQDNGASWSSINNGAPSNIQALFAYNTNVVAGTFGYPYLSTNSGTTWQRADVGLPDTYNISNFCRSGSQLFFAGGPLGSVAGLHWPKGSRNTPVFSAGLWIIGRSSLDKKLHSAVSQYRSEFQPGPIGGTYNGDTTTIPFLIGNPENSMWDIMMLSRTTPPSDPVYQLWASGIVPGAPMTAEGKPQIIGDAAAYWVTNDLNLNGHHITSTSSPMGLEVQNYFFGSGESDALKNTIFMGFHIINKSTITYDSTFLGFFSDVDLGDPTDDHTGCDTTRSLGYTYEGFPVDGAYGVATPAVGYDLIEGPKVPASPGDSALYYGHWRKGYRNLPMTAFSKFINSGGIYTDPYLGDTSYIRQAYNLLNGYIGVTGQPFLTPGGVPSKFVDSGDPVAGTGWLSSFEQPPSDIRELLASGPLTLHPGDTQEVFIAIVIGQGTERLNSITVMRQYDDSIQKIINNNFPGLTGVKEDVREGLPGQFSLSQSFPNPFNPSATINYTIPIRSHVTLQVFNTLGQKVAELVNGEKYAGTYSVTFDAAGLASGVYLYRIQAGSFVQTKKLVVLK